MSRSTRIMGKFTTVMGKFDNNDDHKYMSLRLRKRPGGLTTLMKIKPKKETIPIINNNNKRGVGGGAGAGSSMYGSSIDQSKGRRGKRRNNSSLTETDLFIEAVSKRFMPMPPMGKRGRGVMAPVPSEYDPPSVDELPGMLDGIECAINTYKSALDESVSFHEKFRLKKLSLERANLIRTIISEKLRSLRLEEEITILRKEIKVTRMIISDVDDRTKAK